MPYLLCGYLLQFSFLDIQLFDNLPLQNHLFLRYYPTSFALLFTNRPADSLSTRLHFASRCFSSIRSTHSQQPLPCPLRHHPLSALHHSFLPTPSPALFPIPHSLPFYNRLVRQLINSLKTAHFKLSSRSSHEAVALSFEGLVISCCILEEAAGSQDWSEGLT